MIIKLVEYGNIGQKWPFTNDDLKFRKTVERQSSIHFNLPLLYLLNHR